MSTSLFSGRFAVSLGALVFAAASAACGSGETTGSTTSSGSTSGSTSSGSSSSSGSGSSSSSTGSGMTCPGQGFAGNDPSAPGGSVTAKVVDTTGAAVGDQPIFICGTDICSPPGKTGADGSVSITTNLMMKRAAFKFGDAVNYPEFAVVLPMATNDFGTLTTAKFPATGATIAAGTDAVSNGVTLTVAAGADVEIDPLLYDTADKQGFKAMSISADKAKGILDVTGNTYDVLYAVSPAETTFCPAAKITIPNPNPATYTAGATVEFWMMTTDASEEYARYGGWTKVSEGTVSADGKTVSTTDGFLLLENFAVRLKP